MIYIQDLYRMVKFTQFVQIVKEGVGMKKKIILLALSLMLIATGVSASSFNGDYKGNPIVKITSNGKALELDEVPPMIFDGHTVVPISLLRQLGASVTWDPTTYGVDVKLPSSPPTQNADLSQVIIGFNETAKKYNASNVQLIFNKIGGYVSADLTLTGDDNLDTQNIMLTSSFVAKSPAIQIFINVFQTNSLLGYYDIRRQNVERFINNELTVDEFIKTWSWNSKKVSVQPTITNPPSTIVPGVVIPKTDNTQQCNNVIAQYEKDKQAAIELQNRRGGLYSGGLEYQLQTLEEGKNAQLKALGCAQ